MSIPADNMVTHWASLDVAVGVTVPVWVMVAVSVSLNMIDLTSV